MKKRRLLCVLALLLLSGAWIFFDRELSYYGRSIVKNYHILPLGVYAERRFGFFALWDEYGMSIAHRGVVYSSDQNMNVDFVKKYCFDENRIVVFVEATDGFKYYIYLEESDQPTVIKSTVFRDIHPNEQEKCHWIDLEGSEGTQERLREWQSRIALIMIICFVMMPFLTGEKRMQTLKTLLTIAAMILGLLLMLYSIWLRFGSSSDLLIILRSAVLVVTLSVVVVLRLLKRITWSRLQIALLFLTLTGLLLVFDLITTQK